MSSSLHPESNLAGDFGRMVVLDDQQVAKRREDITSKLFSATKSLSIGQVIRAPDFSFMDSLGALEIMDPKTDSGMILTEDDAKEFMPETSLLPEEIIWVIDQLLAREISWHSGNPLAQTLFSCTYLAECLLNFTGVLHTATFFKGPLLSDSKQVEPLVGIVLRAYILGVIKSCECMCSELRKGNIYEEEDIATNTASLSIMEDIEVQEITKLLEQAHLFLATEKRNSQSPELLEAIETRLIFRKRFLDIASSTATTRERRTALKICRNLLPKWTPTIDLGKETAGAFSTRIQRKLSISVPPRPMVSIDPKEAAKSMKIILDDLAEIETLYDFKSPSEVFNFFDYFAARENTSFAYVRSMLTSHFLNADTIFGKYDSDTFLLQSLIDISHPPGEYLLDKSTQSKHPMSPKFKVQECIRAFLERTTVAFTDLFRVKCQNKSRQRRNLANLVQEWDSIQLDVEKIDIELLELIPQKTIRHKDGPQYAYPLCSWVFHIKLIVIETVWSMGFELDLYQPYEYLLIYSYLGHSYLLHNQQLERIKAHSQIHKKQKPQKSEGSYLEFLITRNAAMENMCKAYCALFMVLTAMDLLRLPTRDKTKEYMRYSLRLKPFWGLSSPEILSFELYQQMFMVPNEAPIFGLLNKAIGDLGCARVLIDQLLKMDIEQTRMRYCFTEFRDEYKSLKKSCIGTNIFIQNFGRQLNKDTAAYAGKTVAVDFKYHPRFGMIEFVDEKSRKKK